MLIANWVCLVFILTVTVKYYAKIIYYLEKIIYKT